ncbi:hypothetical protein GDO78_002756 [Eleutherodactylus coqui]|uniref:Uncharacterized protein n=1 Tax=Eleutherodactylus coqui TaxID=57060 RepID=A0A8J6EXH0_ELECQ|nr:hypothetical protein GDO78_002756 [Eleutherodactylus coqui]
MSSSLALYLGVDTEVDLWGRGGAEVPRKSCTHGRLKTCLHRNTSSGPVVKLLIIWTAVHNQQKGQNVWMQMSYI